MKNLFITLLAACVLISLCGCHPEAPNDGGKHNKPTPTSLTLSPTELSLSVGDIHQMIVTVTPSDPSFVVTYSSSKPEVVSVDARGVVTALAVGQAIISAQVGALQKCSKITVEPAQATIDHELPLLDFSAKTTDPQVIAYEQRIGRKAQEISVSTKKFPGYVNMDLTITAVVYGLSNKSEGTSVILAFSKEPYASCRKTKEMLQKVGFTRFIDQTDGQDVSYQLSINDRDPNLSVRLDNFPNASVRAQTQIFFAYKKRIATHSLLPDLLDFPDYNTLMTRDVSAIKSFEDKLGLRQYIPEQSNEDSKNLYFATNVDKAGDTNILWVDYISTIPGSLPYIDSQLLSVTSVAQYKDPQLYAWLAKNGYPNVLPMKEGDEYLFAKSLDGKVLCALFMSESGLSQLQIMDASVAKSLSSVALYHQLLSRSRVSLAKRMSRLTLR